MDPRIAEVYVRHIHEGGTKIAEFLNAHPDVDPNFIDDITAIQEAQLIVFMADLAITQRIERHELAVE
jgi:hypothetical protein